jgi:hypothetical protein
MIRKTKKAAICGHDVALSNRSGNCAVCARAGVAGSKAPKKGGGFMTDYIKNIKKKAAKKRTKKGAQKTARK